LSLINEAETEECDEFREIRDRFSHEVHVSFDGQLVKGQRERLLLA